MREIDFHTSKKDGWVVGWMGNRVLEKLIDLLIVRMFDLRIDLYFLFSNLS